MEIQAPYVAVEVTEVKGVDQGNKFTWCPACAELLSELADGTVMVNPEDYAPDERGPGMPRTLLTAEDMRGGCDSCEAVWQDGRWVYDEGTE